MDTSEDFVEVKYIEPTYDIEVQKELAVDMVIYKENIPLSILIENIMKYCKQPKVISFIPSGKYQHCYIDHNDDDSGHYYGNYLEIDAKLGAIQFKHEQFKDRSFIFYYDNELTMHKFCQEIIGKGFVFMN